MRPRSPPGPSLGRLERPWSKMAARNTRATLAGAPPGQSPRVGLPDVASRPEERRLAWRGSARGPGSAWHANPGPGRTGPLRGHPNQQAAWPGRQGVQSVLRSRRRSPVVAPWTGVSP